MIFSACNAKSGLLWDPAGRHQLGMKEFCQVGKFAANGWRGALNLYHGQLNSHKGFIKVKRL